MRKTKVYLTIKQKAEAASMFRQGFKVSAISEKFNVSDTTVHNAVAFVEEVEQQFSVDTALLDRVNFLEEELKKHFRVTARKEPYTARTGAKAYVLHELENPATDYPFIGFVEGANGTQYSCIWSLKGEYNVSEESDLDIIGEK